MASKPGEITQLLVAWRQGDEEALRRLMPMVYGELKQMASRYMRHERPDHTLQASALVNEAYIRLVDCQNIGWVDRAHFLAMSATLMRRILVEHAEHRNRLKRAGGWKKVPFDEGFELGKSPDFDVLKLDEALTGLAADSPRKAQIVELRFFGGLNVEETAQHLGVSTATVNREWRAAKDWLNQAMA